MAPHSSAERPKTKTSPRRAKAMPWGYDATPRGGAERSSSRTRRTCRQTSRARLDRRDGRFEALAHDGGGACGV